MTRTTIATDAFTRADGALGSNWTNILPGTTSTPLILSNHIEGSNSGDPLYPASVWSGSGTFTNDQYAQCTIGGASFLNDSHRSGVMLRSSTATDASRTGYYCTLSLDGSYTLRITKFVSGTKTELANVTGIAWSGTNLLLAEIIGTTINVYKTDFTTVLLTTTDSSISTGNPGLVCACGYSSGNGIVDLWEGGSVGSAAGKLFRTSIGGSLSGLGSSGPFFKNPL